MIRVDFNPADFERLVGEKGYEVIWKKHCYCPCRRDTTGQSKIICPLCGGRGDIYFDPLPIRGIVIGAVQAVEQLKVPGRWERGTATITVSGKHQISFYDQIILQESTTAFSELVRHHDDRPDKLNYHGLEVEFARTESTVFDPSLDMGLDGDGNIVWQVGRPKPDDGETFVVRYQFHPIFIIMDLNHAYRDTIIRRKYGVETPVNLPRSAAMQLDFLIGERR